MTLKNIALRICFVTDLHIDNDTDVTFKIDTKNNFTKILDFISQRQYDLLVLGGDLCNRVGDREIYNWINSRIEAIGLPLFAIAGNHDNASLMAQVFGWEDKLKANELYYSISMAGRHLLFLDTSAAEMSDIQFEWLDGEIRKINETVIIFMHHPPVESGSKHMEPRYMFRQSERFKTIFKKYSDKKFQIFCGHYHMERTISQENFTVNICPSTFIQIDGDSETFKPMNNLIGYREIILAEDDKIYSGVIYVE